MHGVEQGPGVEFWASWVSQGRLGLPNDHALIPAWSPSPVRPVCTGVDLRGRLGNWGGSTSWRAATAVDADVVAVCTAVSAVGDCWCNQRPLCTVGLLGHVMVVALCDPPQLQHRGSTLIPALILSPHRVDMWFPAQKRHRGSSWQLHAG